MNNFYAAISYRLRCAKIFCLFAWLATALFPSYAAADSAASNAAPVPGSDAAMLAAHVAASGDVLLESLLTELDRSKAQLKMDQVQAPYYIEYRVSDLEESAAEAAFGSLRENQHAH